MRPVVGYRAGQLVDARPPVGHRRNDRRRPCGTAVPEPQRRLEIGGERVGAGPVRLVDDEHVSDFHQPRLQALHVVAALGREHHHRRKRAIADLVLQLPHADRLEQDDIAAERVQHVGQFVRQYAEARLTSAAGNRADKHARVARRPRHADAIPQDGTARKRTGGVLRDDADGQARVPKPPRERVGQGALARAGPPRQTHTVRTAHQGKQAPENGLRLRATALDLCHQARGGERVSGFELVENGVCHRNRVIVGRGFMGMPRKHDGPSDRRRAKPLSEAKVTAASRFVSTPMRPRDHAGAPYPFPAGNETVVNGRGAPRPKPVC